MTKHPLSPDIPEDLTNMETWARSFANLRYDALFNFLQELSCCLIEDAVNDGLKGRKELAQKLYEMGSSISTAGNLCESAWKICEPFMENKN